MPLEKRRKANRKAPSTAVDPTEFAETPLDIPEPREDPGVSPQMLTPVTYDNDVQGHLWVLLHLHYSVKVSEYA